MGIIQIVVVIIVVGVLLWLVNSYLPMAAPIKKILNIVVVVALALWLLLLMLQWSGMAGNVTS